MMSGTVSCVLWILVTGIAFASGWSLNLPFQTDSTSAGPGSIFFPASAASPADFAGAVQAKAEAAAASSAAGAVISLTSGDIAALGKSLRGSTDPLTKRAAFARLLAGLIKENALEIRAQIDPLEASETMFRDFHFAWGKMEGTGAVLHGIDIPKSDMGPALAGWASADPAAARAWYDSLPEGGEGPNRGQMKAAFVQGLVIADPAKSVAFVMDLNRAKDPQARQMMSLIAEKQIQSHGTGSAASWAAALPDGEMRNQAYYEAARAGTRTAPPLPGWSGRAPEAARSCQHHRQRQAYPLSITGNPNPSPRLIPAGRALFPNMINRT